MGRILVCCLLLKDGGLKGAESYRRAQSNPTREAARETHLFSCRRGGQRSLGSSPLVSSHYNRCLVRLKPTSMQQSCENGSRALRVTVSCG
ncbi:hypothetical protein GN956_G4874 [Arapaima gigas]